MRDAIGTMGTILEDSHRSLTRLGLANHCSVLQLIAMNSSVILLNKHFNTGDFHKSRKRRRKTTPKH